VRVRQVVNKDLEEKLTEKSKNNILSPLDVNDFSGDIPHSVLFFDDAISIIKGGKI
jgi:hypothetical protein